MDFTINTMQQFTFTLTTDEANAILNAIQDLPARVANPLTEKMQKQAREQLEAQREADEQAAKAALNSAE